MDLSNKIDIADAGQRFMNNDALFKKFLFRFPGETGFSQLFQLLEEKNVEEAFRSAHTMKGLVANLALSSITGVLQPMTEVLRAGNMPEQSQIDELKQVYEEMLEIIAQIQAEDMPLLS